MVEIGDRPNRSRAQAPQPLCGRLARGAPDQLARQRGAEQRRAQQATTQRLKNGHCRAHAHTGTADRVGQSNACPTHFNHRLPSGRVETGIGFQLSAHRVDRCLIPDKASGHIEQHALLLVKADRYVS